jgi:ABC-type Fe3+-hydroxamate transport system substrate-binding protein
MSDGVRVVSLVPSATETLIALGITPIACTRFCEQPALPTVGGTKNPDVEAIVALAPDVVVMNDEENRVEDLRALRAAQINVHDMSPHSVPEVGPVVQALCERLGVAVPSPLGAGEWDAWMVSARAPHLRDAFVAVWRRPWMSLAADTYGSSMLDLLGIGNVFDAAADRYPEVTLDDVAHRAPNIVILPSEPYAFTEGHAPEVRAALGDTPIVFVDGRDLFWWGIRTPAAADRLHLALAPVL